jgi:hypothetical protein
LLQQLLDGHPELLVLPSEGTYFTSFHYALSADPMHRDVDRFIAEWIARFVDPNDEPHFKLGRSGTRGNPAVQFSRRLLAWQTALRQARPALAPFALLLALVAAFRDVAATSWMPRLWAEKTPLNEVHAQPLVAAFPEARFIHLVREPSATFSSLRERYRVAGINSFDAAVHTQTIKRSLQLAKENAQKFEGRYLLVRYEDLTDDAVGEMERVREFLGISPSPSLLTPTVRSLAVRSNSSFERSAAGVVKRAREATVLLPADARLVSAETASAARALGYKVAPLAT